jgi:thiol-disulfide isomerase/thioredoxin
MPRVPSFVLTAVIALALAGCDRESADSAQPEGSASTEAAAEQLSGEVDRSLAGRAIPATELADPTGAKLAFASLRGKPALVNLWATWCVPCIAEMPMLDELAAELGDSVAVVTVSEDMDGAAKVVPFFTERKFAHLPQWLDPEGKLSVELGAVSLPMTVLYDAEGKEVWRIAGGFDWTSAEARELIAEATAT